MKIIEDKSLRWLLSQNLAEIKKDTSSIEVVVHLDDDFVEYHGNIQIRLLGRYLEPWNIHPLKDQVAFFLVLFLKVLSICNQKISFIILYSKQYDDENLDGSEISKSERFKILEKDGTDVTRTGKPIDDLDRSDLVAMNYMNFTPKIGPEDETIIDDEYNLRRCENHDHQKQSKVSIYHDTTPKIGPEDETIIGCNLPRCENHDHQKQSKVSFHHNTTVQ